MQRIMTALCQHYVWTTGLDYCNSLYYGLPSSSLSRLQSVQNSLARLVVPSVRRTDHITPILKRLHWLPIEQRIKFKIAVLTFKTLSHKQPTYLSQLLVPYQPTCNLRSSDQHLLIVPNMKSNFGKRSFSFSAPTIWNSLPLALRTCTSISTFRSQLKTHFFPPWTLYKAGLSTWIFGLIPFLTFSCWNLWSHWLWWTWWAQLFLFRGASLTLSHDSEMDDKLHSLNLNLNLDFHLSTNDVY